MCQPGPPTWLVYFVGSGDPTGTVVVGRAAQSLMGLPDKKISRVACAT